MSAPPANRGASGTGAETIELGTAAEVDVPATSANLGPGFDALGLALDWRDRLRLEVTPGFAVDVTGEGAADLPTDESHLVIASALAGLVDLGFGVPGLSVSGHNTIPHGRGLGSSSAAIVAGLTAARRLAGREPDLAWTVRLATMIEGHPDNVAAAVHGGFVLAYVARTGLEVAVVDVHPDVAGVVFVPAGAVATKAARGLLPATVPHADAAANSGRGALLMHAMTAAPQLLPEATRDWLHQSYRRPAMPDSYALLSALRDEGHAAVISGAGPTVLVLGERRELDGLVARSWPGFEPRAVAIGTGARDTC